MLRTRLIVGTLLAALATGLLIIDTYSAPWYPILFLTITTLAALAVLELLALLPEMSRPNRLLALIGVLAMIVSAWGSVITGFGDPQTWVLTGFVGLVFAAFLFELATYRAPGRAVQRLALTVWTFAYLGVLPSFLAMFRTNTASTAPEETQRGAVALALAIFLPKSCDIGAFFSGRYLGRHKMAPVLSPKKTWEGAAGGLLTAIMFAVGINLVSPVIPGGWAGTVAFALTVAVAGIFGDLAESLIKRDCETKDSSQAIPGFGGVLDVVDSILFAAPVAYWWLVSGR